MDQLETSIQPYAWGSRSAIAELQGRPTPTDEPEAELWMGAHPSAPSALSRDGRRRTLTEVIEADPERELGVEVAAEFGGRLPFLMKILAAEKALSIQVHPTREQAERGHAAEGADAAGAEGRRNYVDDWPKPEVLCAVTPFEALAGFRELSDAISLLEALEVPELEPVLTVLRGKGASLGDDIEMDADPRSAALEYVLHRAEDDDADHDDVVDTGTRTERLVAAVAAGCRRLAATEGHPHAHTAAAMVKVSEDHPGDIGLVAALLLRHVSLQPGEAVFLPAGGLHAYLKGTGVELLANSDNVLRAGLTGKHIDVPELLSLVDAGTEVPVVDTREVPGVPGAVAYQVDVPEFRLTRIDRPADVELPGSGPRIVLALGGEVTLRDDAGGTVTLTSGDSAFISAADSGVRAQGSATLYLAGCGILDSDR